MIIRDIEGETEGMIKLIDKQKIILMHTNEGLSQREIARRLSADRKTIRKYIRDYEEKKKRLEAIEPDERPLLISDIVSKPKYDSSSRTKTKLSEEIVNEISFYLEQNREKRATGRSKQVMAKIDIHEALQKKGYDIGYTTVCTTIKKMEKKELEAYIRGHYEPGQVAEFDWGQVKLFIAGKLTVFEMAAFTSAYSNYRYGDIYYNQKTEAFLDAHANFFEDVGGVYSQMVYDNTKVAVAKFVGKDEKKPTDALVKLSMYYGFCFRFCNNYSPHEKGHVEKSVEYIRRKVFSGRDEFDSYKEARAYLKHRLQELNLRPQSLQNGSSAMDMLSVEKVHLLPKPPKYDSARPAEPRVNKYSCVTIDSCYYSVPDHLVGQFVFSKIYTDKILCYHDGALVAEHKRARNRNQWTIDISHFTKTFAKKPGAIASSVALSQMEPGLKNIYESYYRGKEKSFIELIEIISKTGIEKVQSAISELEKLCPGQITTDKIVTLCQRRSASSFKEKNSQIEESSKEILSLYARLLNESGMEVLA